MKEKKEKLLKEIGLLIRAGKYIILLNIIAFFVVLNLSLFKSENDLKDYVIKHKSEIYKSENLDNHFKIDSCEYSYYTDISITLKGDSTYFVIFWGDRESYLWFLKKDTYFTVDIPYNRYENNDVEKDVKIINILNKKDEE